MLLKKNFFNLIEITLAMAIIAIGLASTLALFPIGVNTSRDSIVDNNLADIGEFLMSHLRAGCLAGWQKMKETSETSNNFITGLVKTSDITQGDSGIVEDDYSAWDKLDGKSTEAESCFFVNKSDSKVFLFQQKSKLPDNTWVSDFSVIAKVWVSDEFDIYLPTIDVGGVKYKKNPVMNQQIVDNNFARALCVELSWPAEVPYAQREKRMFRFDVFNEFARAK